ncbi:hypothetical protein TrCOL_g2133 [Triparma columacea]|uniref:Sulfotransferase n=1 Tax=Triparma columacea TaxID=722753 RepID=A0A9W7LE44_9STRA|nr:hypothetical protein TrCOL_g2133 [Triparma columacea]
MVFTEDGGGGDIVYKSNDGVWRIRPESGEQPSPSTDAVDVGGVSSSSLRGSVTSNSSPLSPSDPSTESLNSVQARLRLTHVHDTPHQESVRMYGETTITLGLDDGTCERYKSSVPPGRRYASPAGLFNTGTNLLTSLLEMNCDFAPNNHHFQVPWGKHNPLAARNTHTPKMYEGKGLVVSDCLPIVMVKDPLTWMNSMCKNRYAANWAHRHVSCPNFLDPDGSQIPVKVVFQPEVEHPEWGHKTYPGLVGMWNEWYGDYISDSINEDFPRLIVRYEDLLFRPEDTVNGICTCAGGTSKGPFKTLQTAAKSHGNTGGKEASMIKYGDEERRVVGYKDEDLKFFDENIDRRIMGLLGYKLSGIEEGTGGGGEG